MARSMIGILVVLFVVAVKGARPPDVCKTGRCRCSGSMVDCSGTNINFTTFTGIPNNTRILNLSNTDFQRVEYRQFASLTALNVLDLSNASLGIMSNGAFKGLKRLRYLNISKNENYPLTDNTTHMYPGLFEDLTSLKDLKMYGTTTANLPFTYPNRVLSRLTSLKSLWIDGMNNKTLGEELSALTQLRILRFPGDMVGFGFCDIDTLKNGMFSSVTGITHLYITQCGIQVLEGNVFTRLNRLEYLDLSGNICLEMDGVSDALKTLTYSKLSILVLNQIYYTRVNPCGTVIDKNQVAGLQHLNITKLYVENNAIVKITKSALEKLPKTLTYLGVSNNEFEPDLYLFYVKNLTNVEGIDASYQFFPNMIWFQFNPNPETLAVPPGFGRNKFTCRSAYLKKVGNKHNDRDVRSVELQTGQSDEPQSRNKELATMGTFQHHRNTRHAICPLSPHKVPPIIPFLPPKMKYIDISHCKLNIPIYKITVDSDNSVQIINASSSMLTCWEGPVYGLYRLNYLDLRSNLCTRVGPNFFREFPNLKTLLLSDNLLGFDFKTDSAGKLFQNLTQLEILDMENNRLTGLPPNFLLSQSQLQFLNLRSNQLTEFNVKIEHMVRLERLNLSHNAISSFTLSVRNEIETVARTNNRTLTVDLSSNVIHCYCVNLDFLKWLKALENNRRMKVMVTNCSYENSSQTDISDPTHLADAIAYLERECASKLPLIIGLTAGIVLITNIVVGITVHFYRWKLRYWWYVSRVTEKMTSDGYGELQNLLGEANSRWKYDVYVACASEEREDEFVKEMIDYLENKNGMRLCDSDRDFVPGQSDYRMISNAIHVSRVSIFIVTDKSTSDGRWEIAMRMSQEESLNRGKRVHFGIFLDGIQECFTENKKMADLHDLVRANAFLEYPTGSQMNVVNGFWNKCVEKIRKHGDFQQDN